MTHAAALRLAQFVALVIAAVLALRAAPAHADDRVVELTRLLSSSSDKTRIAAVVALARLGDRRAVKPLVGALVDPSAQVRTVAAVGLGKLGNKAALPALRSAAKGDPDDTVRASAKQAAAAITLAHEIDSLAVDDAAAARARPDLYVSIHSANDDSPGRTDRAARKVHAEIVRAALADQCKQTPLVTTIASDAQRWGLDLRNIDLSVTKIDVSHAAGMVEVEAQIRLAISDGDGKLLSFLSGGAKVQVPRRSFDSKRLAGLRREALENAMRGMFDKLVKHLREKPHS